MSGLHRPACPFVELDRWAVVVGLGAFAPHLVEAETFSGFIGVKAGDEFARIEMRPSGALVMNELTVGEKGPSLVVERGQLSEQEIIYNGPNDINRVGGTSGDVDGLEAGNLANALGLGGIRAMPPAGRRRTSRSRRR